MWTFKIFIWILTVFIQYSLEIEGSESDRFEICLPSVSIYDGEPFFMTVVPIVEKRVQNWFLYDRDLCHQWVNLYFQLVDAQCVTSFRIRSFMFWSVFSRFGLNPDIYSVNLRIQSEYIKTSTRKNFKFEHFFYEVPFFCCIKLILKFDALS